MMSEYIEKRNYTNIGRIPLEGSFDLTYRCNNHCRHCWISLPKNSPQKQNELTLDEIKDIINQARRLGCRRWMLSGGEPMIRPDFWDIFDYVTRKSASYSLNTNATLITPKVAMLLKRKGIKMVALYGATPEVHDHITRNPGSFEATIQGMHYLKEAGTHFTIQLVPMRDNFHQYKQMIELAESLSPDWRIGAGWLYLSACGNPKQNSEIKKQRLNPQEVIQVDSPDIFFQDWQNQEDPDCLNRTRNNRLFDNCIKQKNGFHIDPYGQMSFCSFIKDSRFRYNLRKGSFVHGWGKFIPAIGKKNIVTKKQKPDCFSCNLQQDCRWCPVFGYLEHKDYSAKVEYLCELAHENRQFKNDWKKNHRRYFKLAGITIQFDSDLPLKENTFDPKFILFEVKDRGNENITLHHHFKPLDIRDLDLGQEVYRKPPWVIYKKEKGWIYISPSTPESKKKYFQLAVFNKDYSKARIYNDHTRQKLLKKGHLTTLTMFPTDPFWFAQVLSNKNGLFMHSSGVIYKGQGLLFAGHSGAGKSTMIKLLKEKVKTLCDDRMIIRKWPEGFRIHGTWSHGEIPDVSPDDAPLKAIFFLEKATENKLEKAKKGESLRRLLACLIKPFQTAEWWEKELELIEEILNEVPCYSLRFDKSGKVLDVLDRL